MPNTTRIQQRLNDETGGVLILATFALIALLGMVALVADVSWVYVNRVRLHNAVDAAVLAGIQELPQNPGQAQYLALDYSKRNGLEYAEVATAVSDGNHKLTVSAERTVKLFFAGMFGPDQVTVHARAAARVGSVGGIRGAVPFGVEKQSFVYGQQYVLKEGAGSSEAPYHGNFGALALGGRGATVYYHNIQHGYQGLLRVGDWVETEPGNMAGKTEQGLRYRQEACPHSTPCTWDRYEPDCPRVMLVPIIDSLDANGRGQVSIVGFAGFFLEGMQKSGPGRGTATGQLEVVGRFLQMVVEGEMGSGTDYGLMTYELVE